MRPNENEISKAVSHALRHDPTSYGLVLDRDAWADISTLVAALRRARGDWMSLTEADVERIVLGSKKRRHEIANGKIRALYGHSTEEEPVRISEQPPELLYHGTDAASARVILSEGLKPMARRHVHLAPDQDAAIAAGKRKGGSPVVLAIRSGDAHRGGVRFYRASEAIWLADDVSSDFIAVSDPAE
jgi:putative RNA 2'-phosphotransferase